ncbi:hypothetical protein PLUTE_a0052 [Pseudoalteromonas luteoviolacea DSM 6061]|nr:hypothetical protein [Pseudoalteromonas luteoviolacea DSM 6061]
MPQFILVVHQRLCERREYLASSYTGLFLFKKYLPQPKLCKQAKNFVYLS